MSARVTEKIVKGKEIVILKHTPCTVIGWELHSIDRKFDTNNADRYLAKMPACIYLKFQNVTWSVDSTLGIGVFPLHPVQRTWILNEATQAKIRRTGYNIVPDYAWTAFMSQGMNLEAGLADCGDVFDTPTMSDQMTTYVVLSRFTRADG